MSRVVGSSRPMPRRTFGSAGPKTKSNPGRADWSTRRRASGVSVDKISTVAVIGAGTMGGQIAQQIALHGCSVRLCDQDPDQLERAVERNRALLNRRVDKGALASEAAECALANVATTSDLAEAVATADLVIEAIVEDLDAKRTLFLQL